MSLRQLGHFGVAETLTAITDASDAAGYALLVKEFAGVETHDVLPIIDFLGLLLVAHRRGIRVPDDLAVVGFDGVPESAQFISPLTMIEQPLHEQGRQAVTRLLDQIRGGPPSPDDLSVVFQPRLVVRESAPWPAG